MADQGAVESNSSGGQTPAWDIFTLARYPFLPGARQYLSKAGISIAALTTDPLYAGTRDMGQERLEKALKGESWTWHTPNTNREARELLLSYVWARLLLAALHCKAQQKRTRKPKPSPSIEDPQKVSSDEEGVPTPRVDHSNLPQLAYNYFALTEAMTSQTKLQTDHEAGSSQLMKVMAGLGLHPTLLDTDLLNETTEDDVVRYSLPLAQYLMASSSLRDPLWKLVNQRLDRGEVILERRRLFRLWREVVRVHLEEKAVPLEDPELVEQMAPFLQRLITILSARQARAASEGLGKLSLTKAPPCIQSLMQQLSGGINVPHLGRFTLTSFLHEVGMNSQQIMDLYATAPDFDADMTRYQVEHVLGLTSSTEYEPPACENLKTNGLCVNPGALCREIKHPLSYYRIQGELEKPVAIRRERSLLATLAYSEVPHGRMKKVFTTNLTQFNLLLWSIPSKLPTSGDLEQARSKPGTPYLMELKVKDLRTYYRKVPHPRTQRDESMVFTVMELKDGRSSLFTTAILDWSLVEKLVEKRGGPKGLKVVGQVVRMELGNERHKQRLHLVGVPGIDNDASDL